MLFPFALNKFSPDTGAGEPAVLNVRKELIDHERFKLFTDAVNTLVVLPCGKLEAVNLAPPAGLTFNPVIGITSLTLPNAVAPLLTNRVMFSLALIRIIWYELPVGTLMPFVIHATLGIPLNPIGLVEVVIVL